MLYGEITGDNLMLPDIKGTTKMEIKEETKVR
jgi:hypothetical protein